MPRDVVEYSECHGRIKRTTEKAVLILISEHFHGHLLKQEIWIPRSCCQDGDMLQTEYEDPMVADWWLVQNGLL